MPFVKGDKNINRKGRVEGGKRGLLSETALKELAKKVKLGSESVTKLELLIAAQTNRAIKGDTKAAEFVATAAFGRPPQSVALTGDEGGPIKVEHRGITEEQAKALEDVILGLK